MNLNSIVLLIILEAFFTQCNVIRHLPETIDYDESDIFLDDRTFVFKWCGEGDSAKNYDDVGTFGFAEDSDKCCRKHDHCEDVMEAGELKHGLLNSRFHTKLDCECDEIFFRCLVGVNSKTANIIGDIYFNRLGTECFKKDHPAKCVKTQITGVKYLLPYTKCIQYTYDKTKPKIYQWFDVPLYDPPK